MAHLHEHNLNEELQSAYRPQHSCETALLRVQQDIASAMDKNKAVLLVMLDMSAAFDTIDAALLMDTLHSRFGVTGTALQWFSSYMTDRTHCVRIGSSVSSERQLKYGVPQGSVLGPLLFTIYTTPVSDILKKHGADYHKFADDLQLSTSYYPNIPGDLERALTRLKNCVHDIKIWLIKAKLKLNDGKTEFLALVSRHQYKTYGCPELPLDDLVIKPVDSVRNLGAHFDRFLTMHQHVSATCAKANFHLRRIGSIRRYITREVCHSLVVALVMSHLDYCNALLSGLSGAELGRMQKVQNRAARLVTLTPPTLPATPLRKELHWLPVHARISFKVLVYVYKSLNGLAPDYLSSLLTLQSRNPRLRQLHDDLQLATPVASRVVGRQAFSVSAPLLWNKLPLTLRQKPSVEAFKKGLKTHLFTVNYPS